MHASSLPFYHTESGNATEFIPPEQQTHFYTRFDATILNYFSLFHTFTSRAGSVTLLK
jgi:hypothetical protein